MTGAEYPGQVAVAAKVGWVLVHFVWQGAAAALLLAGALRLLRRASANMRYVVCCGALAAMAAGPVVTWLMLGPGVAGEQPRETVATERIVRPVEAVEAGQRSSSPVTAAQAGPPAGEMENRDWPARAQATLQGCLPYVVYGWLAGVWLLSLWRVWGWLRLRDLRRRQVQALPGSWQVRLGELAQRVGIRRPVGLLQSARVKGPVVLGWLKPVILLPGWALTGLGPQQLEAILLHELAHVRRCDYLVNLLQVTAETVGFYHPAVWWVSARIRQERENCCDDLAARVTGNRVGYAHALVSLAEQRHEAVLAVAASGSNLRRRVGRLIGQESEPTQRSGLWSAVTAVALVLGVVLGMGWAQDEAAMADSAATDAAAVRVLHFAPDRSLGRIVVQPANADRRIETFFHWIDGQGWEYLAEARGDVVIPAGQRAGIFVNKAAAADLSPLLRLKPDDLYSLCVAHMPADDRCMPYVGHLAGLRTLNLANTDITSEGMKHIAKLQSLERLTLPRGITDKGLASVARLGSLRGLYFKDNQVTDAGLVHLEKLRSLEEMEFGSKYVSAAGLAHLVTLPRLEYLSLWGPCCCDEGIKYVRNMASLKTLSIAQSNITNAGLENLAGHPTLENLRLALANVTDEGLTTLKTMAALKKIDLSGTQVTEQGLVHLKDITSLEYLSMPRETVTDAGLAYVGQMRQLRHLSLPVPYSPDISNRKRWYTDEGLRQLSKLEQLEELDLAGPGVTAKGMQLVGQFKGLTKLTLFGCPIGDEGLAQLQTLDKLEELFLYANGVTISGLAHLNGLRNMVRLDAHEIEQDDSVLNISGLVNLEYLTIGTGQRDGVIRDDDLACLANLKKLKWLQISSSLSKPMAISDKGMAHLAGLTQMERLTVGGPDLTDEGIGHLANMHKMDLLNIIGCRLTDRCLEYLGGMKSVRDLRISGDTDFTAEAVEQLRQTLPNLNNMSIGEDSAAYWGGMRGGGIGGRSK